MDDVYEEESNSEEYEESYIDDEEIEADEEENITEADEEESNISTEDEENTISDETDEENSTISNEYILPTTSYIQQQTKTPITNATNVSMFKVNSQVIPNKHSKFSKYIHKKLQLISLFCHDFQNKT